VLDWQTVIGDFRQN